MFSTSFSTRGSWGCTFKSMPAQALGIRDPDGEGKVRPILTGWTRALLKWGSNRGHTETNLGLRSLHGAQAGAHN